jgi:hypothetical protein
VVDRHPGMRRHHLPSGGGDAGVVGGLEAGDVEVVDRAAGEDVDLAVLVGDGAGGGVGDELEVDLVEIGPVLHPVFVVADEVDVGAALPLLELERAGADRRRVHLVRGVVGALVDVRGDDRGGGDLHREHQRAEGLAEHDLHRAVVGGGDALDLVGVDRAPARMDLRQEHVEREDDVLGRERLAVVPGDALLQVEGVGERVVGDLPLAGERRLGLEVGRVAQQRLVDVAGDHVGRAVLVQALHQHRRLRRHHDVQRPALLRLVGPGCGARDEERRDRSGRPA